MSPSSHVAITSTPITTSYYAGTPLYLTCTVQLILQVDTPTIVTWLRGLSIITIDNYTTVSPLIRNGYSYFTTLFFNPLGTADSGQYKCNSSVQPGVPNVITEVGGGLLSLQVLGHRSGRWFAIPSGPRTSCSQCHHHSFSISTSLGVAYTLTCQPLVVAGLVLSLDLMWSRADSLSLGTTPVTNDSTITLSSTSWSAQNHAEYNCTAIVLLPLKGILVSSTASIFLKDTQPEDLWTCMPSLMGQLEQFVTTTIAGTRVAMSELNANLTFSVTVSGHTSVGLAQQCNCCLLSTYSR
ncbi:hypothetical protein EMCRGX_G028061 [Ephydatia muelleri]